MTVKPITASNLLQKAAWMLLLVACDSFHEEPIIPGNEFVFAQTEFFVLPGSSIVIDRGSLIKRTFAAVSLTVSQAPASGTLTELDRFLLKYTPNDGFNQGNDKFVISVVSADGTTISKQTMTIAMKNVALDFPCGVYAIEDRIRAKSNHLTAVNPLTNDQVCGVDGLLNVSIHLNPSFGDAVLVGDAIIYSPGPSFAGNDELVYRLSKDSGEAIAYGIVSFEDKKSETISHLTGYDKIFFVNERVGFIAAYDRIMKTEDGGVHWHVTYDPPDGDYYYYGPSIEAIFFLDERIGFASFSKSQAYGWGEDMYSTGGWIMTSDGGVSWKETELDVMVKSILFTSPLVGYISATRIDPVEYVRRQTISRTVDGGETWQEVLSTRAVNGDLKLRFANDMDGYAYNQDRIFVTKDGGISWTESVTSEFVGSVSVTRTNRIYASIDTTELYDPPFVPTASTIIQSENGTTWTKSTSFPYAVELGFSPFGDVGIAIGSVNRDAWDPVFQVSVTLDGGNQWTIDPTQVHGIPLAISVPSPNVAYILCLDKIIKYTP